MNDASLSASSSPSLEWPLPAELFEQVYHELRCAAARQLAREKPGQTIQPTGLVHEAILRLTPNRTAAWESREQFFMAATKAMRRILIERARHKNTVRAGGEYSRVPFRDFPTPIHRRELLALGAALDELARRHPRKAELVKLRFFFGFTIPEAAKVLGISNSTADNDWAYAKAWLRVALSELAS